MPLRFSATTRVTPPFRLTFAPAIGAVCAVLLSACAGGATSPTPAPPPAPTLAGRYDLVQVEGAPLGTGFTVGCGAPDTFLFLGTGSITTGWLDLGATGRFQLAFDFTFTCGAGTITNRQGGAQPLSVSLMTDPGTPNGIIYRTSTLADGSIDSDVGIGTNRGPLIKTFRFRKPS